MLRNQSSIIDVSIITSISSRAKEIQTHFARITSPPFELDEMRLVVSIQFQPSPARSHVHATNRRSRDHFSLDVPSMRISIGSTRFLALSLSFFSRQHVSQANALSSIVLAPTCVLLFYHHVRFLTVSLNPIVSPFSTCDRSSTRIVSIVSIVYTLYAYTHAAHERFRVTFRLSQTHIPSSLSFATFEHHSSHSTTGSQDLSRFFFLSFPFPLALSIAASLCSVSSSVSLRSMKRQVALAHAHAHTAVLSVTCTT